MDIVWGKIPPPASWHGAQTARFCIGRGHLFICYVAYDSLLQIAWVIPKGSYGDLRERGLKRIYVEGGAAVLTAFLAAGLVQRMVVVTAPMLTTTSRIALPVAPRRKKSVPDRIGACGRRIPMQNRAHA